MIIPGILAQLRMAPGGGEIYPLISTPVAQTYNSSTHTVFIGSTANVGDLMLIFMAVDGNTTVATPAGWTLRAAPLLSGSSARAYLFERIKESGDGNIGLVSSASTRSSIISVRVAAGTFDPAGARPIAGTNAAAATSVDLRSVTDPGGAAPHQFLSFVACDEGPTITGYPLPNQQTSQVSSATPAVTAAVATQSTASDTLDPGSYSYSASVPSYAVSLMVRGFPA